MENQNYGLTAYGAKKEIVDVEFFVCNTNDIQPDREQREMALVITDVIGKHYDTDLDMSEIQSLIDYLTRAKTYIENFNEFSETESIDFSIGNE